MSTVIRKLYVAGVVMAVMSMWSFITLAQTCPTAPYTPNYQTKSGNGDWNDSGDWNGGAPPGAWISGGVLTIPAGQIIKINSSNFALPTGVSLVVNGTLVIDGKLSLDAGESVTIAAGAILCCEGASCGSNSDRLSIGGSIIWDGGDGPIAGPASSTGGPLPVELLFFKVEVVQPGVRLTWATASERNASYFAVEKSANGKDFQEIGRIDAAGTTISRQDYAFLDENALLGRNYYRLKEVDFDGEYQYFNITFADTNGKKAVLLFPNPIQDNHLQFKLNFASDSELSAKVYNATGSLVSSFSFEGTSYKGESNLRSGSYLLKVTVGKDVFTQRFIVP